MKIFSAKVKGIQSLVNTREIIPTPLGFTNIFPNSSLIYDRNFSTLFFTKSIFSLETLRIKQTPNHPDLIGTEGEF